MHYRRSIFLSQLRALADYYGALLIFDETMTAFRFEPTAYDGIHPDLSLVGQALANGYPLAAIVGQEEFFREVEPHHFALPGNGGELLLAIADVTLTNLTTKQVTTHCKKLGDYLQSELTKVIHKTKLDQKITLVGHPSWLFLNFAPTSKATPTAIVEFFCKQMAQEGILMVNNHNFCANHTIADVEVLIAAYGQVLPHLKEFYTHRRETEPITTEEVATDVN
ncbi:MAG: aminotransferase class III-fold pyridoxal phosphate-dependent enzyme [Synechococcaceae cyanobacterium RL_1_2]|nr:aminotransferase class III-fold pyridoxal phosphate-dependent enzyme [Synechococcaceae cyanobacterium RL_1_2]